MRSPNDERAGCLIVVLLAAAMWVLIIAAWRSAVSS